MSNTDCFDVPPNPLPEDKRTRDPYLVPNGQDTGKINFSLRKAMISDVRDILDLVNGFANQNLMLARGPQYIFENIRDFVVAVTDELPADPTGSPENRAGRIIACASLHVLWEDVAEIRSTAIHPDCQNMGLGKKLIESLKTDGKRLGIHTLFTFTLAEEFFAALGFVRQKRDRLPSKVWGECSRCPKFFKCDEVGMILEI
ncbi:MAG: N-acetyltransferase [Deltaproteobacteria bacterium]|nr:MAG: N-acetyltransferase [Deltaproteobacteria bacterium]RTZ99018.1 MAG: N-acetyltransferase [Deltaproteobacteria bacterium]